MTSFENSLWIFLNLAKERKKNLQISDHARLMVLSAASASELGMRSIAHFCRSQVIKNNPGHMLGRFDSVRDALDDEEFQYFLAQIQRKFPVEHVESELAQKEIDWETELVAAGSVEKYLTQLLGVDYTWIEEHFQV